MTNVAQIAILSVTLLAAVQTRQSTAPASTLTERDRVEIQELVARYARALSTCAAKEYAELFMPDGVFVTDDFRGARHRELYGKSGRLVGRAKLMELVETEEFCLSPKANAPARPGGGSAARPAPTVTIEPSPEGARGTASLGNGGHYEDVYVKTSEGWRFKSRTVFMPPLSAPEQSKQSKQGEPSAVLSIREIGSMHVGGRAVTLEGLPLKPVSSPSGAQPSTVNPNGDFEAEQMYVQYVRLAAPRAKYPLLMVHGGGLTGVTWETKPDGQPGWQMFFLRAGHDVYIGDGVERGRASWARYPEIFKSEPSTTTKKIAWETFRIGRLGSYRSDPTQRTAFSATQFPIASFDQFAKQFVPAFRTNGAAIQAAYDALVQKICPCVMIVHSQGGNFGYVAALNAADKVKAVIAIEPAGAPDPDRVDMARLKTVPHLVVWGDYFDGYDRWNEIRRLVERYEDALRRQGGTADRIDLPAVGVKGNSHMVMMDRNSDQVAALIQGWIEQHELMR
jgi:pimeloyl-ACP methyl ester carboxylesterase